MANQANSLSHTKWICKYHVVFVPKYRRKIIYNQYRADLQEIIRTLCKYNVSSHYNDSKAASEIFNFSVER